MFCQVSTDTNNLSFLVVMINGQTKKMSRSASGAMINSAAMAVAHPALDFLPASTRRRVSEQVRLPSVELLRVPGVDWYCLRRRREVIPEIFNQLKLLRRTKVENRDH